MSDHPEYVKRMLAEHDELKPRVQKLNEFIAGPVFKTLDQADKVLMYVQLNAMEIYSAALGQRLRNVLSRLEVAKADAEKMKDVCMQAVLEQIGVNSSKERADA